MHELQKNDRGVVVSSAPSSVPDTPAGKEAFPKTQAVLAGLLLLGALVWAQLKPLGDPDLFWHLKTADILWTKGLFLRENHFSWVTPHGPWVNFQWLAQLLLWASWQLGGVGGLYVLRGGLILTAFGLAYATALRAGARPGVAALVLMAAMVFLRWRFHDRPELFSMALIFAWFWFLPRTEPGRLATWWPLWLLQMLWANLHGLYFMGPMLAGWWVLRRLAGEPTTRRHWRAETLALLVLGLMCLVNPNGPALLAVAVNMDRSHVVASIPEYLPFFTMVQGWEQAPFWGLLVLALGLSLRRGWLVLLTDALLIGFLLFKSLEHTRVAFVAVMVFTGMALPGLAMVRQRWTGWGALVLCPLLILPLRPTDPALELRTYNYPQEALFFAARHGFSRRLMHDMHDGGFLIWRFFPRFGTFVDPRFGYDEKLYADYDRLQRQPWKLTAVARKYDARSVVRGISLDRDLFYAEYPAGGDFTLRYFDDTHTALARRDTAAKAPALKWLCPCAPGPWLARLAKGPHRTAAGAEILQLLRTTPVQKGMLAASLTSAWARYTGSGKTCREVFEKPWGRGAPAQFTQQTGRIFEQEKALCLGLNGDKNNGLAALAKQGRLRNLIPEDLPALMRGGGTDVVRRAVSSGHPAPWVFAGWWRKHPHPDWPLPGPQRDLVLSIISNSLTGGAAPGQEVGLLRLTGFLNTWLPEDLLAARAQKLARRRVGLVYPEAAEIRKR